MNNSFVQITPFGCMPDGKEVFCYKLSNQHGMSVEIINLGATIRSIQVPSKNHEIIDVVLGFDDLAGYLETFQHNGAPYFGAVVGRYAGRIANGQFMINAHTVHLETNHIPHHLHGGAAGGFANKYWTLTECKDEMTPSITLKYISPDGENGYPGTLDVKVTYRLDNNTLNIIYEAMSSEDTIINLTNHSYFNLDGHEKKVDSQELQIFSDHILETNSTMIPTGERLSLDNLPQDFRMKKMIIPGLDHSFVMRKDGTINAVLSSENTGIKLSVKTNQPCLQVYVGGSYIRASGKRQVFYHTSSGVCFEAQHFPDSPNHPQFPSTVLKKGANYFQETSYHFATEV